VGEIFTAIQGRFAKLDGLNKAGFLHKVPANSLLRERIRVTAPLNGKFRQLMLLLRCEMYFHDRQCRVTNQTCQRDYRRDGLFGDGMADVGTTALGCPEGKARKRTEVQPQSNRVTINRVMIVDVRCQMALSLQRLS
jgi:hypothetical protein